MAPYDLLITNATCIIKNSSNKLVEQQLNIAIKDGKIADISTSVHDNATETIDASGLHLLPGLIDTQVHLREPGLEHKETIATGLKGAALGGITGVFEMPNTSPPTDTPARLQNKLDIAAKTPWANYAFFAGATPDNIDNLEELEQYPGCSGVKVFMGSSTGSLLISTEEILQKVLAHGSRRVAVHCEDEALLIQRFKELKMGERSVHDHPLWRSEEVALTATKKLLALSTKTNRPVHVLHVTTAQEMDFLRENKSPLATVECTPQHLTLSAPDCYDKLGTFAQMNPPIRSIEHQEALWKAIADGTVDVIGSDHAPHTREEKARPYPKSPSGMTGVQTTVPIMLNHIHQGRLSLVRLVQLMSERPSEIYKIKGKGEIKIGNDADFTLVDLKEERTIDNSWIASLSGWTPFHGKKVIGWPKGTMVSGQWTMRDDELLTANGRPFDFEQTKKNS